MSQWLILGTAWLEAKGSWSFVCCGFAAQFGAHGLRWSSGVGIWPLRQTGVKSSSITNPKHFNAREVVCPSVELASILNASQAAASERWPRADQDLSSYSSTPFRTPELNRKAEISIRSTHMKRENQREVVERTHV